MVSTRFVSAGKMAPAFGLAVLLALAGCSNSTVPGPPGSGAAEMSSPAQLGSSPAPSSGTATGSAVASGGAVDPLVASDQYRPEAGVRWVPGPEGTGKTVAAFASAIMAAFVDTATGQQEWWTKLEPLLTPEYATDAQFISVDRIALRTVSAPTVVNEAGSPVVADALFETNDGRWTVRLNLDLKTGSWLAADITKVSP